MKRVVEGADPYHALSRPWDESEKQKTDPILLRPHRREPRKHASFSKPPPLGEVARLAVTEGVRLIHFAMQKSGGTAPRKAKNTRFCAENMVTFRHRVLLHPTSSGAPSQREPLDALMHL